MKKVFTLLTLALMSIGSAWAADYVVTATRVLSNSDKTCTWSVISANGGSAIQSNKTALGDGLYFVAAGKITLNGGNSLNIKASGEMYIEVPSASSAGSVTINNGSATDRYFETVSEAKIYTKDDGNGINTVSFTSADIVDVNGVKYLKLTSKSDCKFGGVSITLTSGTFPSLGEQEITAVSICGNAISASDLATLKSTHALSVAGSTVNGMPGTINVTVANGATTVTRTISGTSAIYTFAVNAIDYTITITNINETYTSNGCIVAHSGEDLRSFTTADGITFTMVKSDKTFQFGSGKVTISGNEYTPLKLSTGSAVEVTFPAGAVATKVKVYGWSADGNGKLASMGETSELAKSVDVSGDVYYAKNTADDIYPSVYEYDLDNWTSLWFNPGGSPSQPFVVMEFTLDKVTATIGSTGWATYCTGAPLDFTSVTGLKAYIVTGNSGSAITTTQMTGTVPANTPLLLEGTTTAIPVAASSSTDVSANKLKAGTGAAVSAEGGKTKYVLSADGSTAVFKKINATAATVAAGKAYLEFSGDVPAPMLSMGGETTGINAIDNGQLTIDNYYNLAGQRVAQPTKGLYIVNGRKVIIK